MLPYKLIFDNLSNFYDVPISYLYAFREVFDAEALSWLSVESYLLLWVCLFWITLGLVKTVGAKGVDIVFMNSTTKYSVLVVLFGAIMLSLNRGLYVNDTVYLLNDMVILDNWVNWSQLGILVASFIFVTMTPVYSYTRNSYYYELLLFALTVTMLMTWLVVAWNFIIFYLVLEGISLVFYTIATRTFSYGGVESGLKYYSLGALASVLLLVGILCVFSAAGSTDFLVSAMMLKYLSLANHKAMLITTGLTLILAAVFFKLSAFPGHVWTPDVYEGTSLEVLWIFAVLAKYAFIVIFLRFFVLFYTSPNLVDVSNFWVTTACLGSLIVGALGAFTATSIKRFIAYTAINQMGFLFMGLVTFSADGMKNTVAYLYIYMLANVLFFAVVTLLQSKKLLTGDLIIRSLKDITLLKKAPLEVGLLAIALLSLGGLPPLAGFIGKYALWSSVINSYITASACGLGDNLLYILITSIIISLLSTFYYLRLIKMALFDSFENWNAPVVDPRNTSDISLSSFIIVILGALTVSWMLMLTELDAFWTRFALGLVSPLSVLLDSIV
jgi:NADH:ubiquinone oxidoreductase subunit 2 (chain N)